MDSSAISSVTRFSTRPDWANQVLRRRSYDLDLLDGLEKAAGRDRNRLLRVREISSMRGHSTRTKISNMMRTKIKSAMKQLDMVSYTIFSI